MGLDTFQRPDAINRFVVHDRDGLKYSADGSLDILLQPERPADEGMFSHWLPAPSSGLFSLQARLYTQHHKVLVGLWTMPAAKRAKGENNDRPHEAFAGSRGIEPCAERQCGKRVPNIVMIMTDDVSPMDISAIHRGLGAFETVSSL